MIEPFFFLAFDAFRTHFDLNPTASIRHVRSRWICSLSASPTVIFHSYSVAHDKEVTT